MFFPLLDGKTGEPDRNAAQFVLGRASVRPTEGGADRTPADCHQLAAVFPGQVSGTSSNTDTEEPGR